MLLPYVTDRYTAWIISIEQMLVYFLKFVLKLLIFIYVYMFSLCVLCVYMAPHACLGLMKSELLDLESQVVVSCHVGAETQIQVIFRASVAHKLLGHLFTAPQFPVLFYFFMT